MGDPINPLETEPDQAEALPAAEAQQDPVTDAERAAEQAATNGHARAAQSASEPALSLGDLQAAAEAFGLAGARTAPQRPQSAGPVIGDVRQLAVIQQDTEQTLAEAQATRRAVQLLAISLGALAVLAIVYTVRAQRGGGQS